LVCVSCKEKHFFHRSESGTDSVIRSTFPASSAKHRKPVCHHCYCRCEGVMLHELPGLLKELFEMKWNEKIYFQPLNNIHIRYTIYYKDSQCLCATGWYGRSCSCMNPDHKLRAIVTGRKNGVRVFGLVWEGIGQFGWTHCALASVLILF
jgi:hypothetical protein